MLPKKKPRNEKIGTVARKRKLIDQDIQVANKKKDEVTKCIEVLKMDTDSLSIKAEEIANLDLLTKANSFRKTILEKEKVLKDLYGSIIKMEESKKKKNLNNHLYLRNLFYSFCAFSVFLNALTYYFKSKAWLFL